MKISVVGIDLSKEVFHFVCINHRGREVERHKCRRAGVLKYINRLPSTALIVMEACQGAHFWCRELKKAGYDARQIPAQHVKPYCKKQKNDYNDARAIAEAGSRADAHFVAVKSAAQQELEAVVNSRDLLVRNRTALLNQARGLLAEQGVVLAKSKKALTEYLHSAMQEIGNTLRMLLRTLGEEINQLSATIDSIDDLLEQRSAQCSTIKRLKTIPGVGTKTAVALITLSGNPKEFTNGRHFAAHLGLVPRQMTTGGVTKLGGISKKGDRARRSLLVIGAQSAVRAARRRKHHDEHSLWIKQLYDKKGQNRAAVAVANKNARIAWRIMTTPGLTYQNQLCH